MHRERLEQAIRVLRAVQANAFHISHWYDEFAAAVTKSTAAQMRIAQGNDCGFVACAVGHMARDPWFNSQGLTLRKREYAGAAFAHTTPEIHGETVTFGRVKEFFEIDRVDAYHLFSASNYCVQCGSAENVTPAHVIARIEELLKDE
jgi:hypothetical protein